LNPTGEYPNCRSFLSLVIAYIIKEAIEMDAKTFLNELERNSQAKALARKPGHLALMCHEYRRKGIIYLCEAELYDSVIDYRLSEEIERAEPLNPDEIVYKRQVLEELAFHLQFCRFGQTQLKRDELLKLISAACLHIQVEEQPVYTAKDGVLMLENLVRNSGLLREQEKNSYQFERITFREFLAARYVAQRMGDGTPVEKKQFTDWIYGGNRLSCTTCDYSLPPLLDSFATPTFRNVIVFVPKFIRNGADFVEWLADRDLFLAVDAYIKTGRGESRKLCQLLQEKMSDFSEAWECCEALLKIRDKQAVKVLAWALREPGLHSYGRQALTEIGGDLAIAKLIDALNDVYPATRYAAVWALDEIGGDEALEAICRMVDDVDGDVRRRAVRAITKIGAEKPPDVKEAGLVKQTLVLKDTGGSDIVVETDVDAKVAPEYCLRCGGITNIHELAPNLPFYLLSTYGCSCP
jgi:hypothetical protein